MGGREVVASLGDCLVREQDLRLLQPGQWLNDQILGFYFELCQENFPASGLAFVGPEVTQLVRVAPEGDLEVCLEALQLSSKAAVFLAVNNNPELERPGGSHWSLLVFVRAENSFFHLDSSGGMNCTEARQLKAKLEPLLASDAGSTYQEVSVEQQSNGSDCGVHVILHTDQLARQLVDGGWPAPLQPLDTTHLARMAEVGLGFAAVLGGVAGLYRLVRPRFKYRVNCHFCCQDSMVPYLQRNSFTCRLCDQYNGWDSTGDYDAPLLAPSPARYAVHQAKAQPSRENGLCRSCNLNQELKVAQLARSRSEGQELEEYAMHLERAYRLCAACEEEVRSRVRRQDAILAPGVLEHRLERSRLDRSRVGGEGKRGRGSVIVLQTVLAVLLMLHITERFKLLDLLARTHPLMEGLYLLSDFLFLYLPSSPIVVTVLVLLLLLLQVLQRSLTPSLPTPVKPRNIDSFSARLSTSLLLPPEKEPVAPTIQEGGSLWGEALTSPPPPSPSHRLFSCSTPASLSPPLPLKTRDEVTINHEFALGSGGDSDSDCDLSILSLGAPARSPSPRSPFPHHLQYSPPSSSLSLFSPRRPVLRPARLTSASWVAGGYWTAAPTLGPTPPSRSSSQSSGFVSATPSVANYFSQQGSVAGFSCHSGPLLPSPPPSLASELHCPPSPRTARLPTGDPLSSPSERGSPPSPSHKGWTLTVTLTPGGVLLALSVAVNLVVAVVWCRGQA